MITRRNIPEEVLRQDKVLNARLVEVEDAILTASTEEEKAKLIEEAYATYGRIVANMPNVYRPSGYNPVIEAETRRDDAWIYA